MASVRVTDIPAAVELLDQAGRHPEHGIALAGDELEEPAVPPGPPAPRPATAPPAPS